MSMKILIVSDTHGVNSNLRKAIKNMGEHLDLMIHLGDSMCEPEVIEGLVNCPVEIVRGNCDSNFRLQGAKLIDIAEHKAFITHGHNYNAKWSTDTMKEMARENGADIVMFGHTHEPLIDKYSDIVVLNPGSLTQPRQEGRLPTYIVMTVEDDGRTDYSLVTMNSRY